MFLSFSGEIIIVCEKILFVLVCKEKRIFWPSELFLTIGRIVRKPDFCLCENKAADQLRGNREADQRLCFRYTDSIFPLLLISEISSF